MRLIAAATALLMLALGAPAFAETNVGVTAAVNQDAKGTVGSNVKTISLGDSVVFNQRIQTGGSGLVQVLLADGTTFMVGPNSDLVIDSFVYDPNAGTAQVTASFTKGVLRFIGGQTSKTEGGVTINTPVGTMGIRGAMVDVVLDPPAGTPPHVDMLFGNEVTLQQGQDLLGRLYAAGYSLALGDDGKFDVLKTPPGWGSQIQAALAGAAGTKGGAPKGPSDGDVKNSDVANNNSGKGPDKPGLSKEELDALLYAAAHYDELRNFINNNQQPNGFAGGVAGVTNIQWPDGYWEERQEEECGEDPECEVTPYYSQNAPFFNAADPETLNGATVTVAYDANGAPVNIRVPIYLSGGDCNEGSCLNVYYDGTNGEGKITVVQPNGQTQVFDADEAYLEDYSPRLADSPILNELDCNCDDMVRWGFWGFSSENVASTNGTGSTADLAVDSMWITGDLATRAQLDNLASESVAVTASYSGDAVGVVQNSGVDGKYVATGDLNMEWNFGLRAGTAEITNFDTEHGDHDYYFELGTPTGSANFVGDLELSHYEDNVDRVGYMSGGFVNSGSDVPSGVFGNWGAMERTYDDPDMLPGYVVGGVFMGQRSPN